MTQNIKEEILDGISSFGTANFLQYKVKNYLSLSFLLNYQGKDRAEQCYLIIHDLITSPLCHCGEKCKFRDFKVGFCKTCGNKNCANKLRIPIISPFCDEQVREKARSTIINRHGGLGAQSKAIQNKMKSTLLSQTRFESNLTNGSICRDKINEKFEERYGGHPLSSNIIKEKIKNTLLLKYGVDHISKSEQIRMKAAYSKHKNWAEKLFANENLLINNTDGYNYSFRCVECGNNFYYTQNIFRDRIEDICPTCFPRLLNRISKGHGEIAEFIQSLGFEIILNDRNIIAPKEIDIVVPGKNLGIEYNGLHWHSEKRVGRYYHKDKYDNSRAKGFDLITIFENDWLRNADKIKALLRMRLGKINGIGARDTTIIKLEPTTANEFFTQHHLQNCAGKYYYGLYYKDNLIAAVSLNKMRVFYGGNIGDWELGRYVTTIPVIGGLSKLLKKAHSDLDIQRLHTYCDHRYFSGKVYEHSGFNKISTSLGYWWIKDYRTLLHRYSLNKQRLVELAKSANIDIYDNDTESVLSDKLGYSRIYDCGQSHYIRIWN